ncbi:hypothetical protein F4811DRAFT_504949 [Daldinia bambusicola]|nr:hypothetical protein F4811DRAFT_504949 [Daldinia bambusicola]
MEDSAQVALFATMPGAYVCFDIKTKYTFPEFKPRHLLKRNYKEVNGDLSELKYIGYCNVIHPTTRTAMLNAAYAIHGLIGWDRWIVTGPALKGWDEAVVDNAFIEGAQKLASENADEMLNASVSKVWFFLELPPPSVDPLEEFGLHMKISFSR